MAVRPDLGDRLTAAKETAQTVVDIAKIFVKELAVDPAFALTNARELIYMVHPPTAAPATEKVAK